MGHLESKLSRTNLNENYELQQTYVRSTNNYNTEPIA